LVDAAQALAWYGWVDQPHQLCRRDKVTGNPLCGAVHPFPSCSSSPPCGIFCSLHPEAIDSLKTRFRKAHRKVRVEKNARRHDKEDRRHRREARTTGGKTTGGRRDTNRLIVVVRSVAQRRLVCTSQADRSESEVVRNVQLFPYMASIAESVVSGLSSTSLARRSAGTNAP
jgi:hypothetical protein